MEILPLDLASMWYEVMAALPSSKGSDHVISMCLSDQSVTVGAPGGSGMAKKWKNKIVNKQLTFKYFGTINYEDLTKLVFGNNKFGSW